jgi:hypothetical protein
MPGQRVRVIATGNPPTTAEGMWVMERWGAWLDRNHPNPALPGELRWYATINGKDTEVEGPGEVVIDGVPYLDEKGRPILAKSRTFIPAELQDNPDLEESGYAATLAGLPEELRRTMGQGDFSASMEDDAFQLFPSAWVEQAMGRWTEEGRTKPMTVIGVDIAQGGRDRSVFARRHGDWFDHVISVPGIETPNGSSVAGRIVMYRRDGAEIIIDMGGGYGGSTRDHLMANADDEKVGHVERAMRPTLFVGAGEGVGLDRTGRLKFINKRASACWAFREALDPSMGSKIALPPDQELKAELAAFRWEMVPGAKVKISPKDEIKERLGRSPDKADAIIMAHFARGKTSERTNGIGSMQTRAITSGRKPGRR